MTSFVYDAHQLRETISRYVYVWSHLWSDLSLHITICDLILENRPVVTCSISRNTDFKYSSHPCARL